MQINAKIGRGFQMINDFQLKKIKRQDESC